MVFVSVFRNSGKYTELGTGKRVLANGSFEEFLDDCTRKLNLPRVARKVFDLSGVLIVEVSELEAKKKYAVSMGEAFRRPGSKAGGRRSSVSSGGSFTGRRTSTTSSRAPSAGRGDPPPQTESEGSQGATGTRRSLARSTTAPPRRFEGLEGPGDDASEGGHVPWGSSEASRSPEGERLAQDVALPPRQTVRRRERKEADTEQGLAAGEERSLNEKRERIRARQRERAQLLAEQQQLQAHEHQAPLSDGVRARAGEDAPPSSPPVASPPPAAPLAWTIPPDDDGPRRARKRGGGQREGEQPQRGAGQPQRGAGQSQRGAGQSQSEGGQPERGAGQSQREGGYPQRGAGQSQRERGRSQSEGGRGQPVIQLGVAKSPVQTGGGQGGSEHSGGVFQRDGGHSTQMRGGHAPVSHQRGRQDSSGESRWVDGEEGRQGEALDHMDQPPPVRVNADALEKPVEVVDVPRVQTVCLRGLPRTTTEAHVRSALGRDGHIVGVDIVQRRGVAFVDFSSAEEAAAAVRQRAVQVNGAEVVVFPSESLGVDAILPLPAEASNTPGRAQLLVGKKIKESFPHLSPGVEASVDQALLAAWVSLPRELVAALEGVVDADMEARQRWIWAAMDALCSSHHHADRENIRFLDLLQSEIELRIARFRHVSLHSTSLAVRLLVIGPRLSGKSTVLYHVAKSVVHELAADEKWRSTFVFTVDWMALLVGVKDLTLLFSKVLEVTVVQLALQKDSLTPIVNALYHYFVDLTKQKWVPRLPEAFVTHFKPQSSALQLYSSNLQKAWLKDKKNVSVRPLAALICDLPVILAQVLGFDNIQFIYDHFDATARPIKPPPSHDQSEVITLAPFLAAALKDHSVLLAGQDSLAVFHCLQSPRDLLSSLQVFHTYDLVSERAFLNVHPECDVDLVVEDQAGQQYELSLDLLGGCPAFLSQLVSIVHMGDSLGPEEGDLTVVEESRRQAYAVELHRLVRVLTVGNTDFG